MEKHGEDLSGSVTDEHEEVYGIRGKIALEYA